MGPDEKVINQVSALRDTVHDTSRAGGDIPAGTPYHRVLDRKTKGRGIPRGILAIVLLFGGLLGFGAVAAQISGQIDLLLGRDSIVTGGTEFTTVTLAATFASSALLIPWSMLIQRWLYGVKGRTMHSVTGVFRAAVLGRAVLVLVPVWAVYMTVLTILQPAVMTDWAVGDLLFMFVVTVLIVPLQTAGEEYGFRGLIFRVAASWGRSPRSALALGVVVSSVLFATIHLSTDIWLNLQFLAVGITFALITWRTGGLETSVVLHAANNSLGLMLALALHADLNATTDRSSGVGSMAFLIPVVLLAVITGVIWYRTRHTGPALTPAL
ncbi:CPBP family intramembrane metalloprotease [Arthrobacter gengyunqii]|uniref:CPBP family intramembrane metalloprotease n=1 Tax=Arthrobacter gengyunqii TaxID=2886940 RepID=A0A9X1M3P5_9MICC|nr:CPBP family intramembrane glutamic endopeptidase [Arthrobacter gengyunqii]MCC3270466.1 CPBP family intramembrane metalloprotease [Arthrobacter gengyunqii]UOY97650.1 CPBP family intramembrane metalloprotease [Arthrobacter gengyunqii]